MVRGLYRAGPHTTDKTWGTARWVVYHARLARASLDMIRARLMHDTKRTDLGQLDSI
jgi:hypothetical protein